MEVDERKDGSLRSKSLGVSPPWAKEGGQWLRNSEDHLPDHDVCQVKTRPSTSSNLLHCGKARVAVGRVAPCPLHGAPDAHKAPPVVTVLPRSCCPSASLPWCYSESSGKRGPVNFVTRRGVWLGTNSRPVARGAVSSDDGNYYCYYDYWALNFHVNIQRTHPGITVKQAMREVSLGFFACGDPNSLWPVCLSGFVG
ncbi:hypothetical protein VTO42DRAFT_4744 [Malbranchea cinnamomea]